MITCAVCGQSVTKRQSLLIEPFGRICRSHPEVDAHREKIAQEVAAAKAKLAADREMQEAMQRASHSMSVICMTEAIRVLAYREGAPIEVALLAFASRIPNTIREEVVKEVLARGSITDAEMSESISTAMHLKLMCKH